MISIIVIIFLSIALLISLFANYKQLHRSENLEEALDNSYTKQEEFSKVLKSYNDYFVGLIKTLTIADLRLQQIDSRGSFSSDDEIGWFFQNVKSMMESLNQFKRSVKLPEEFQKEIDKQNNNQTAEFMNQQTKNAQEERIPRPRDLY